MSGKLTISVVDFQDFSVTVDKADIPAAKLTNLGEKVCTAFKEIGFVYLTNHGISQTQIDALTDVMRRFVSLPTAVKSKYPCSSQKHGWNAMGSEALDPGKPPDIKEVYNFIAQHEKSHPNPDADLPGFSESMRQMYSNCFVLADHVLHIIGVGLRLKDVEYFCKQHNLQTTANRSSLRSHFYPSIPTETEIKPGQLRCGKHSDWGSITLVFQDKAGGLQIKTKSGEYVHAEPIDGSVLVNIGDIMQRWTNDELLSMEHRVVIPENQSVSRQSIGFFVNPDDDCEVASEKYPTVIFKDYIDMKIKESTYA